MQINSPLVLASLATLALFTSCAEEPGPDTPGELGQEVSLEFAAMVGDKAFDCEGTFPLGKSGTPVSFSELKFYVHGVELVREGGESVEVTLTSDEVWQSNDVALLDFEDRTGNCANGTPETNSTVEGTVAEIHDDYVGVRFTLGIPFELNHADVGALPSPLNLPTMFWSWQGGRKFLRLDGKVEDAGLRFHLGSTGCTGTGDSVSNCNSFNRADIELSGFDPTSATIAFDLATLYEEVELAGSADDETIGVCMSAPDTPTCVGIFGSLGIPYGDASGGAVTAFRGME